MAMLEGFFSVLCLTIIIGLELIGALNEQLFMLFHSGHLHLMDSSFGTSWLDSIVKT